jgi:hypothetical protein
MNKKSHKAGEVPTQKKKKDKKMRKLLLFPKSSGLFLTLSRISYVHGGLGLLGTKEL